MSPLRLCLLGCCLWGSAWGASSSYLAWQPVYDLWLPAIDSSSHHQDDLSSAAPSSSLPFAEPKLPLQLQLSPTPVPFQPMPALWAAGASGLFASVPAPVVVIPAQLFINGIPSITLREAWAPGTLPWQALARVEPTGVTLLALWPSALSAQAQAELSAQLEELLAGRPPGNYQLLVQPSS